MVNVAKIGTATRELGAWLKAGGYKYVAETKPAIFHGINPKLTYPPSGRSFELPRFCTEEMKEARRLNKIAIQQAKAGKVVYTYPKATSEDLKRLTSQSIEGSYSRVTWTNPKNGKVYHLLKQGETSDGKVVIRILDEQGVFIKEAEVVPKKILIADDFDGFGYLKCSLINTDLTHGNMVKRFVKAYNPFAEINITNQEEENLLKIIKSGERIDFVNCSFGYTLNKSMLQKHTAIPYICGEKDFLFELDKLLPKTKTRIIFSSGNGGKNEVSTNLIYDNFEGCGALNLKGKITDFSSSRNSMFTQHYEQGQFKLVAGKDGIIIKGTPIVIPYDVKCNKIGQRVEDVLNELVRKDDIFIHDWQGVNPNFRLNSVAQYYDSKTGRALCIDNNGRLVPALDRNWALCGTSYSTPIRTAKLALNDMMQEIL